MELKLHCCNVQLGPTADGQLGVLPGLQKLTRLELTCDIMDQPQTGSMWCTCLDRMQHLQHLHVHPERKIVPTVPTANVLWLDYTIQGLPVSTLPCLQQLTYLSVHNLAVHNLPQVGSLTHLQGLSFGLDGDIVLAPSTMPDLVFPTSLTSFHVQSLAEVGVLSRLPTGLKGLELCRVVQGPAEGPDLLLSGVARQKHLTQLWILSSEAEGQELVWPVAGPAYSALTASSSLASLAVSGWFPEGILPHVFPAQRRLPHLTHLKFGTTMNLEVDVPVIVAPPPVWSATDLSRLVSCCPSLCSIIDVSLQRGRHVSTLSALQDLGTLHVQYGHVVAAGPAAGPPGANDEGATYVDSVKGLAMLTRLRGLRFLDSEVIITTVPEKLLPLTCLKALTELYIQDYNVTPWDFWGGNLGSPVWLQLLENVAQESLLPVLQDLAQQLAEQGALIAQLQQQLADHPAAQ